jgi:hypothetical protein
LCKSRFDGGLFPPIKSTIIFGIEKGQSKPLNAGRGMGSGIGMSGTVARGEGSDAGPAPSGAAGVFTPTIVKIYTSTRESREIRTIRIAFFFFKLSMM